MKKIATIIIAFLFCAINLEARTFVLITGVSNYDEEGTNLAQTTKDAKRFKEVMEKQTKDITILTSRNVTKANVLEKLRAICNRAQSGDKIIFFYSGHGMPGALYAYNGAIPYDDILNLLGQSAATSKLCFIDACHAGSAVDAKTNDSWTRSVKDAPGTALIVSCRPEEISYENPVLGSGLFTQSLLKGLLGKSDTDGNRQITLIELFKYVYNDVLRRSDKSQHPQLIAPKAMHNNVVTSW